MEKGAESHRPFFAHHLTISGLMVFGFCPAGSTSKVDLTFGKRGVGLEYVS